MKRFLLTVLVLQFIIHISYSQTGWVWQNPKTEANNIFAVKMFNSSSGLFFNSDNILKTENGGQSWEKIYTGFPPINSSVSEIDENTYYMLTDSSMIIKSTDKGQTWKYVSKQTDIKNSLIFFKDNTTGFAFNVSDYSNFLNFHRTTNGGINWQKIISADSTRLFSVKFINQQTGFAVGRKTLTSGYKTKIFKTIDGGMTWDTVQNNYSIQNPGLYFANESTGYLFGTGSGSARTYITTNSGLNWSTFTPLNNATINRMQFISPSNGFVLSGNQLGKTTNGGLNWSFAQIIVNGSTVSLSDLRFTDVNTGYMAGNFGSIIKTTNGGINWIKISGESLTNETLYDISFANQNTGFAIGEYGKILSTTNGGDNWSAQQFNQEFSFTSLSKINSNVWYIASWNGKILKTDNAGLSWDTVYAGGATGITRIKFINQNIGFGVCKYFTFFKTTNAGANWSVTQPFGSQQWSMDFINENTGFVGGNKTYKTTDGGVTWDTVRFGGNYYTADIQFVNQNTGYIASDISTGPGSLRGVILKTTDGGATWSNHYVGNSFLTDLYFINERIGFTTNQRDIFKTTDGGVTWNYTPTCMQYTKMSINFADSLTGWITGAGGEIIKTTNGGTASFSTPPYIEIPTQFYLYQNYPNPFNPVTTIRYGLPKDIDLSIKIYDILGKLVKTLVNGNQTAGSYTISFDGSQYASGVYFYTIETPDFIQSKKMVLLK